MAQFKEIRRGPQLPDMIAAQIMERINSGELYPGDLLPTEHALAESFGVSRNVVREAIARLRSDGIIESKKGRGAIIKPLSERETFRVEPAALGEKKNLGELFELRGILEIESAGLAAIRRTDADLTRLEIACADMDDQQEFDERRLEADAEFHRSLGAASGNQYLQTVIDYISSRLKETTRATAEVYKKNDLLLVTNAEHKRILDAVRACDFEGARQAMASHIRGASERLGVDLPPKTTSGDGG